MQFLTIVSIQPIFCFSNPLHLISVSLWMRCSCSLCYSVCTIVLTDMQMYICLPGPVISLIWGLGLPLQDTGGQWMWNHPGPIYPWFGNQRTEDFCDNLKSQGRVVLKVVWRVKQGCWMRMQSPCTKLELGVGMLRSKTHPSCLWESHESICLRYW